MTTWSSWPKAVDVVHLCCPWPHYTWQCCAFVALAQWVGLEVGLACAFPPGVVHRTTGEAGRAGSLGAGGAASTGGKDEASAGCADG
jgi:hypothetical protein